MTPNSLISQNLIEILKILSIFSVFVQFSCNGNDDDIAGIPPRDRGEQQIEDDAMIVEYLKTHSYRLVDNPSNPTYKIAYFDTITDTSSNQDPINDEIEKITITRDEVDYTLYYLTIKQGAHNGDETTSKPTRVDSTFVTYRGELFYHSGVGENDITNPDRNVFESRVTPVWLDLATNIDGFREVLTLFNGTSTFTINPVDGTSIPSDDFSNLVVFIPSGLAYFNNSIGNSIPAYSSLIFNIQLYQFDEADHDNDGIPTIHEDLDKDGIVFRDLDDDTDENNISNYVDIDDDGDGTPTEDEITFLGDLNNDGRINIDQRDLSTREVIFYDDDGDGIYNHLDPDDEEFKND